MSILDDVCLNIVDCEHKTAPIQDIGIPSIRTTDIKNGVVDFEGANKVSEITYKKWTRRLEPQEFDLILAREAPVGEVGIIPKNQKACLGQRTVLLRPNPQKVYPYYLLFLLLSREVKHEMMIRASGSTVEHLNMSDIRGLKLPDIPPLEEQRAIASVLSCLDEKIDNLRKQNKTLEAIAQTLFKHWFIDFEFPNDDGKPYKSSGGEMVASELGEIPKDWTVGKIEDTGKVICGKTPSKSNNSFFCGEIPFIKIPDMHGNIFILDTTDKLSALGSKSQINKLLPPYSLNISCIATVGLVTAFE